MLTIAKELLMRHEGYRKFVYKDTVGLQTIGYGRNLVTRGVSRDEALYLLENDIAGAIDDLRRKLPWFDGLDDIRKAVLIDMAVNLGIGGLLEFKRFLAAMEAGDYGAAAVEMLDSKWAQQVGARATELAALVRG